MNKKILLIHRYYYPDTPAYAIMLHEIAKYLHHLGNEVDVFTSKPSYYGSEETQAKRKEIFEGININRTVLLPEPKRAMLPRALNSFLFSLFAFFKILFGAKYNLITVATTPPLMISTMARWACKLRRIPFLYHCQDIYPEIAFFSKTLTSPFLYKIFRKIDTWTCKQAKYIVVLSDDMKNTLMERGIQSSKIKVINNFIRSNEVVEEKFDFQKHGIQPKSYKVVFCGNLGKLQNLDMIIDAALSVISKNDKIQFIFIGEGVVKKAMEQKAGHHLGHQIIFTGYTPLPQAINCLKYCDLGLIPIAEGVHRTAYPSKTMTNLYCGLKSIVLVEDDSVLKNFVETNQLGYSVAPRQLEQLIFLIHQSFEEGKDDISEKNRINQIAISNFGKKTILPLWGKIISPQGSKVPNI